MVKVKKDEKGDKGEQKDELSMKLEWLRMKRKVNNLSEMHPLTLNIDAIYNLPPDIKITDDSQI